LFELCCLLLCLGLVAIFTPLPSAQAPIAQSPAGHAHLDQVEHHDITLLIFKVFGYPPKRSLNCLHLGYLGPIIDVVVNEEQVLDR
jgi:hypothetical protein